MKYIILIATAFALFSCGTKTIQIASYFDSEVGVYAADELDKYLNQMYTDVKFETVGENEKADIQLVLSERAKELGLESLPSENESFKVIRKDKKLYIVSPDGRGLLNGTYALLEKLGCGFYISGDVLPESRKWVGFDDWDLEDSPLLQDRSLFNWHNFISGCTGWNLKDWQLWIDQANKMRYNGIMVHAYGNNPMFSYEYLGEKKATGYFNNTASGRDWGNQHVNDVRRLVGGDLYDEPVYGAKPSFASEEKKDEVATELMQQVFQYAEERGTKVIFALDFDTWMSHPQNIVKKLPKEALFELNGYLTPNPEHPEGYKYYKHQVSELLTKYPQIDELTVWSRSPKNKVIGALGTIWMAFPYEKFPEAWKEEYHKKLAVNPNVADDLMSQGLFAFSKIVETLQRAATDINPELKIAYGSWNFHWLEVADAFLPKDVAFSPLDATIEFDLEKNTQLIEKVGAKRSVKPIVWAHHDDFSYIGRPYAPYENLSDLAKKLNIQGLGIIHWTTHPLDIYFTGTGRQLWQATANEPLKETIESFVKSKFGTASDELMEYYTKWMTEGPMFGRETSDHFIDLGKVHWKAKLKPWEELIPEAKERIAILESVPEAQKNAYWKYQKGMEEFYISFFENQAAFMAAYKLAENGKTAEAAKIIAPTNTQTTIALYVAANKNIGFTAGEEALVISLNTRWYTDFLNLKQRVGLAPVNFKFSPTQHDPLAQIPGLYTYFVDDEKVWWRCLWENEMNGEVFVKDGDNSFLQLTDELVFNLKSMHGQDIPLGYLVKVDYEMAGEKYSVEVADGGAVATGKNNEINVSIKEGKLLITNKNEGKVYLSGIEIIRAG